MVESQPPFVTIILDILHLCPNTKWPKFHLQTTFIGNFHHLICGDLFTPRPIWCLAQCDAWPGVMCAPIVYDDFLYLNIDLLRETFLTSFPANTKCPRHQPKSAKKCQKWETTPPPPHTHTCIMWYVVPIRNLRQLYESPKSPRLACKEETIRLIH